MNVPVGFRRNDSRTTGPIFVPFSTFLIPRFLSSFIKNEPNMTFREQWNALLGKLGIATEDGNPTGDERKSQTNDPAPAPNVEPPEKTLPPDRTRPDPRTIRATRTRSCEDPSPTEPVLSANAAAYTEDARNFR